MLSDRARKLIEELDECPIYLLGIMQRKMVEEKGEILFIAHMTHHITLCELKHLSKPMQKLLRKEIYERMYYEFVMEGWMPTHKYEEIYTPQQTLRIHMMRIERKEFRDYEKRHKKEISNLIHYADNHFRRDDCFETYWRKVPIEKENSSHPDLGLHYQQGCYPFK